MTTVPRLIVLDDDPTGTQAMADVPVLLRWDRGQLERLLEEEERVVHLITNSRALPAEEARAVVEDAARTARQAAPEAHVILRGDSTLRGHLLAEYLAVRAVRASALRDAAFPVLLLVPALPAAGRVTVGGVHFLEHAGQRTPLHETEYARDPAFGYGDARLLAWAEERSGGFFPADAGSEILLGDLRRRGPQAVTDALRAVGGGRPAVCAADAEDVEDLRSIAAGLRAAEADGADVIVRCAPTFAGVLSDKLAVGTAPMPSADGPVLVVCGSYVPATTRQLAALTSEPVEADVRRLASRSPQREIRRLADQTSARLEADGYAVLATPRERPTGTEDLEAQRRIAHNFAAVVGRLRTTPGMMVVKGGVTSAVTAVRGLGVEGAHVVGPVADGVGLWRIERPGASPLPYLVVPGNVGDDDLLARLVSVARGAGRAAVAEDGG